MIRRSPLWELTLCRFREFAREPEVIFWVFGFPILLAVGLGIAFRNKPPDVIAVGVIEGEGADGAEGALLAKGGFQVERGTAEAESARLRLGKLSLLVLPGNPVEYRFDPTRPE